MAYQYSKCARDSNFKISARIYIAFEGTEFYLIKVGRRGNNSGALQYQLSITFGDFKHLFFFNFFLYSFYSIHKCMYCRGILYDNERRNKELVDVKITKNNKKKC